MQIVCGGRARKKNWQNAIFGAELSVRESAIGLDANDLKWL